jgi:hypothetical protein
VKYIPYLAFNDNDSISMLTPTLFWDVNNEYTSDTWHKSNELSPSVFVHHLSQV